MTKALKRVRAVEAVELVDVGAGAEDPPGAGDDDGPDGRVVAQRLHAGRERVGERARQRVQAVGPLERQHAHAVRSHLDADRAVASVAIGPVHRAHAIVRPPDTDSVWPVM